MKNNEVLASMASTVEIQNLYWRILLQGKKKMEGNMRNLAFIQNFTKGQEQPRSYICIFVLPLFSLGNPMA